MLAPGGRLPGVKRKRAETAQHEDAGAEKDDYHEQPPNKTVAGLVDYDSE